MKKRTSLAIMKDLLILGKEQIPDLLLAIVTGVLSFFSSVGIALLAALLIVNASGVGVGLLSFKNTVILMAIFAIVRGLTRYLEQYMNHLVAFKILCMLRDKVFAAVRRLAPAKLQGSNKGSLISIITADIELVEVFYAHTISPIVIALICGTTYLILIASFSPLIAVVTLVSYVVMSVILPVIFSKWAKQHGRAIRKEIGHLNNIFLDLLRGMTEIMQFAYRDKAIRTVQASNKTLVGKQSRLIEQLALLLALEDVVVVLTSGALCLSAS